MNIATQIRMDEKTYEKVKKISDQQGRSINKQMIFAIEQYIKDYEKVNGTIKED